MLGWGTTSPGTGRRGPRPADALRRQGRADRRRLRRSDAGEVVCLLGPNGAGKTTTIEILEGFRSGRPATVTVLGQDPARATEAWRARTGVVLQSWRDHPRWTPRRLLDQLGGYYAPYSHARAAAPGPDRRAARRRRPRRNWRTRRSRRSPAGSGVGSTWPMGIVGRPELLFLDEPTAGFDPQARREFHQLVHRLADLEHTTILLTTHDLDEAEKLADRVLDPGRRADRRRRHRRAARPAGGGRGRGASGRATASASCTRPTDATAFVQRLLDEHGEPVVDLEVRRASLEDAYLALVQTARGRPVRRGGPRLHGGDLMAPATVPASPRAARRPARLRRGWTEFVQSLRSSQDQWFYLFTAFLAVGYLYLRRDTPVEGTDLLLPSVALPSILGGLHRVRPGDRSRLQPGDGEGGRHAPARQGGAHTASRATSPASCCSTR